MRNHSNENEFDLHENEHASETNFHMNGFAPRLVLRKRQKSTRKWPINWRHDPHLLPYYSKRAGTNVSQTRIHYF